MEHHTYWNARGIAMSLCAALLSVTCGCLLAASLLGTISMRDETGGLVEPLVGNVILTVLFFGSAFWASFPTWAVRIDEQGAHIVRPLLGRRIDVASVRTVAFDSSTVPRSLLLTHTGGHLRIFPAPTESAAIAHALSKTLEPTPAQSRSQ